MINNLRNLPKVTVCANNNFSSYGSPIERFFADNVHLSQDGTRLLSGNLIRTIFGSRSNPRPMYTGSQMDISQNRKKNMAAELARAIMNVL